MDSAPLLFDLPPIAVVGRPRRRRGNIQDAIVAFLSEPRSAKEIANHIDRKVPTATGQLQAMVRKGVVVRLAWGVYGRRDLCPDAPDPTAIRRNSPVQELVLRHALEASGFDDLAQRTGRSAGRLRELLRTLNNAGHQLPERLRPAMNTGRSHGGS